MRRKIPSNTALMAFEAAARHRSFARAADELALTEGAISRQIARLEAFLGITLFERIGNRVRLLPNGERYAVQVRASLDRLERDSRYVMGQSSDSTSLDIATIPTFAMRWLIPRLARFQQQHPGIEINLTERMAPFVLADSGFDAAIHFEHPAWAGMHTYPLVQEVLVPVCIPSCCRPRANWMLCHACIAGRTRMPGNNTQTKPALCCAIPPWARATICTPC